MQQDKLIGLTVIRDLILAEPSQTLTDVMLPEPFALTTDMDLDDAVRRRFIGTIPCIRSWTPTDT